MKYCSLDAYSTCPDSHLCGSLSEAIFTEGSECDLFNQKQNAKYSGCMVSEDQLAEAVVREYAPNFVSRDRHLMTAVRRFLNEYARAVSKPHVRNPLGYALYQTWKKYE